MTNLSDRDEEIIKLKRLIITYEKSLNRAYERQETTIDIHARLFQLNNELRKLEQEV